MAGKELKEYFTLRHSDSCLLNVNVENDTHDIIF